MTKRKILHTLSAGELRAFEILQSRLFTTKAFCKGSGLSTTHARRLIQGGPGSNGLPLKLSNRSMLNILKWFSEVEELLANVRRTESLSSYLRSHPVKSRGSNESPGLSPAQRNWVERSGAGYSAGGM
jgi:hypothetical protein